MPPHERHLIYMSFLLMEGWWQVQFHGIRLGTSRPLKLTFADPEKIRGLARQGDAMGTSTARQTLEHAIHMGSGGVYLRLTPEQYRKLRAPERA
jgi:hypothetical protein